MATFQVTVQAGDATASASLDVNSRVARFVGAMVSAPTVCPTSVNSWLSLGQPTFGNQLMATKMFYSGTQPMTTWQAGHLPTDNESMVPANCLVVVTYKDGQIPGLAQYAASVPAGREVWMAYWQEAEDSYPNQDYAKFIQTSQQCAATIRAVGNPSVKVVQNCAGSKYGVPGSTAEQGLWVVPGMDIYSVDTYQNQASGGWPQKGLAGYTEFQNWLKIYSPLGPLAITEYGIDSCTSDTARNSQILMDAAYLRKAFGGGPQAVSPYPLQLWNYWWSNCSAGQLATDCAHQHHFTDAATIATWTGICAGTV